MSTVAISVNNAYKKFSSGCVLNDLNMNVPEGSIYSLLGPSGCGKTTLLSCILGLELLTSGSIQLCTRKPKEIGYMPQEISLHPVFTIKETFHLYGRMYGMKKKQICDRIKELFQLLNLPDLSLRISQLSGGEQRRMSLAVTMFHDPKLVLLDEPTVGLDPVLHHSVWEHLIYLTKNMGRTVVITTHYIEESRRSDKVGLMRAGGLLVEEEPGRLMTRLGCPSMEEVFLKLCPTHEPSPPRKVSMSGKSPACPVDYNGYFNVHRFTSQLQRNYIWTKRSLWIMVSLLLLPASQSVLFCSTFGRYPTGLRLGMYSEELRRTPCVPKATPIYTEEVYDCSVHLPFSCILRENLATSLQIVEYSDLEEGMKDTKSNQVWGVVHIKANFTPALLNRISLGLNAFESDLEDSFIDVRMDMTNFIIRHHLQKILLNAFLNTVSEISDICKISRKVNRSPIKFNKAFYGGNPILTADSELAGFISAFCFYFGLMFTAGALSNEKLSGVLKRNQVAGMTYFELMAAHMVVQVILLFFQTSIMLLLTYYYFDYVMVGSFCLVLAILLLVSFVGVSLGLLLSNIFESSVMLTYAVIGATLSVFNLGGVAWPQAGMHAVLRSWLWAAPTIPAVDSLRAVISKGFSPFQPQVYIGIYSCLFWISMLLIANYLVVRWKK